VLVGLRLAAAGFAAARVLIAPYDPALTARAQALLRALDAAMSHATTSDPMELDALRRALEGPDAPVFAAARDVLGVGATSAPADVAPAKAVDLERLLRVYRRLNHDEGLEGLLEQVADALLDLTNAERAAIVVHREGGEEWHVLRDVSPSTDGARLSRAVLEQVRTSGEPLLSVDAVADARFDQSRSVSHLNLRSVLAVPLVHRGELLGAAYVDHRLRRGAFGEADLERVEAFAQLAALAVAHAHALEVVRAQALELARQGDALRELLQARQTEIDGLKAAVRTASVPVGPDRHGLVGPSPAMRRVSLLIDRVADADVPVLIEGESGTGKEVVARAIHRASARASAPFIAENCAAIPETLLESVLFGHARGAFTGADRAREGLFEAAGQGTLFLDEVGEMTPGMQAKLLRVLQEAEVKRLGETRARRVDARVIAATNRNLEQMVEAGTFRRDLYFRLHVVKVELPPLRTRPEDVPALVTHFLERFAATARGRPLRVAPAAMELLQAHAWPGNVRELENEVQRWTALVEQVVGPDDLSPVMTRVRALGPSAGRQPPLDRSSVLGDGSPAALHLRTRVDELERELCRAALGETRGNQTQAAALLGLSRFGLQKKLRRLGLDASAGGPPP
jgi:transcriptional regulator with GAF, ATPase, and Fis domain